MTSSSFRINTYFYNSKQAHESNLPTFLDRSIFKTFKETIISFKVDIKRYTIINQQIVTSFSPILFFISDLNMSIMCIYDIFTPSHIMPIKSISNHYSVPYQILSSVRNSYVLHLLVSQIQSHYLTPPYLDFFKQKAT